MRKGILLLGGSGTRFRPVTNVINKHFIPIMNRPMFFYSLSCLMISNIRSINIISNQKSIKDIKKLIGDGSYLGLKIRYTIQKKPIGITDGINLSKKFIGKSNFALMLGDNFFYSDNLPKIFTNISNKNENTVISYRVEKPENFGVIKLNKNNSIKKIIEKPKKPSSNLAVTGFYFYQNNVLKLLRKLKKSNRNEYEISDFNNLIIKNYELKNFELGRGAVWLDSGTPNDHHETAKFVKIIEERTVGPDLGKDSINAGIMSLIIGFILVVAFMFYKRNKLFQKKKNYY